MSGVPGSVVSGVGNLSDPNENITIANRLNCTGVLQCCGGGFAGFE
jgi:hypothetical protein